MDRVRRIAGMGRTNKAPSAVHHQKDKDESIVFFRELQEHETHIDVNLLEPIYSVEFDTIQGGRISKLHSGKRDFLTQVDEKHDYDWLQTPPAASLFPSIDMEANYSEMGSHKGLQIPSPLAKSSASRLLSGKTEATKTPAKPAPVKPPPPESSSRKNLFRGAAASMSKERSIGTSSKTTKKRSDTSAIHGSSASAAEESPYKPPPKNLLTTGPVSARRAPLTTVTKTRAGGPELGAGAEGGKARRPPPAATQRGLKELQDGLPAKAKGKAVTAGDGGGHAGEPAVLVKGMKRTDGKIQRRPRFATM